MTVRSLQPAVGHVSSITFLIILRHKALLFWKKSIKANPILSIEKPVGLESDQRDTFKIKDGKFESSSKLKSQRITLVVPTRSYFSLFLGFHFDSKHFIYFYSTCYFQLRSHYSSLPILVPCIMEAIQCYVDDAFECWSKLVTDCHFQTNGDCRLERSHQYSNDSNWC